MGLYHQLNRGLHDATGAANGRWSNSASSTFSALTGPTAELLSSEFGGTWFNNHDPEKAHMDIILRALDLSLASTTQNRQFMSLPTTVRPTFP
jgi:hypothetical protein